MAPRIECYLTPVIYDRTGVTWLIREMHTNELLDWAESIDDALDVIERHKWRLFIGGRSL